MTFLIRTQFGFGVWKMADDDGIAAAEIARQIAALRPRVQGARGVMGYLQKKREDDNERSYWAQKKAEKTRKLWENLHAGGTVSVENAPDFSSEESEADDVKPPPPQQPSTESPKSRKKRKKHSKKSEKKAKRRRSRS
ncbi:hypothetical protein BBJ28_00013254 [Nothophytophthora sp. Chile5]|nr:hypothetical protein BBJ28_00013254 [Nothophytophthora sp. Chile5]